MKNSLKSFDSRYEQAEDRSCKPKVSQLKLSSLMSRKKKKNKEKNPLSLRDKRPVEYHQVD